MAERESGEALMAVGAPLTDSRRGERTGAVSVFRRRSALCSKVASCSSKLSEPFSEP